jgi:hypothetical protein
VAALDRRPAAAGSGFESSRYLGKWLLLSTCIGLVAGLGAIAFYLAIDWSTQLFFGQLVGYLPPSPIGEGSPAIRGMDRPWLFPLVVGLGGLFSGLIVVLRALPRRSRLVLARYSASGRDPVPARRWLETTRFIAASCRIVPVRQRTASTSHFRCSRRCLSETRCGRRVHQSTRQRLFGVG